MFQEKFTIWRTRKGAVDIVLITVMIFTLLILPLFIFFISAYTTQFMISEAKETLEIASLATYTKLNQDSLGMGIIDINELSAETIFYQQINLLINERSFLEDLTNPQVSIFQEEGKIIIESEVSFLSSFKQLLHVNSSLEFIIDPTMEGA